MKRYRFTAGVLAVLAVSSFAWADYRFDDLYGPSGISDQWMVISNARDTFGASHSTPIDVSGDLLTADDAVLNVLTGQSENEIADNSLNTLFFVAAEGEGTFTMNFRAPAIPVWDAATPNLQLSTPFSEGLTDNEAWIDTKISQGQPEGRDGSWRTRS